MEARAAEEENRGREKIKETDRKKKCGEGRRRERASGF